MGTIIGLKDTDRYVSHYTRIETVITHILPHRRLKMGSFARTNDPKESKTWSFTPGSNGSSDILKRYGLSVTEALSDALTNEIKGGARVLSFCKDRPPLSGNHLQDIFNRGFAKPRMWAQYAGGHTGVCLVFDRAALHERISQAFSAKCDILADSVVYRNREVVPTYDHRYAYIVNVEALEEMGLRKYAAAHAKYFRQQFFFEKMTDWRDEEEYRWVVLSKSTDDLYFDYGDSLKAVIFGENIRSDLAELVMGLTVDENVEWQGIKWKNCSPWYDFGNLKYNRDIRRSRKWNQPPLPYSPQREGQAEGMNRRDE